MSIIFSKIEVNNINSISVDFTVSVPNQPPVQQTIASGKFSIYLNFPDAQEVKLTSYDPSGGHKDETTFDFKASSKPYQLFIESISAVVGIGVLKANEIILKNG